MSRIRLVVLIRHCLVARLIRHESESSLDFVLYGRDTAGHIIDELGHFQLVVIVAIELLDHAGVRDCGRVHGQVRHDAHVVKLAYFSILLDMKDLVIDLLLAGLRLS